MRARGVDRLRHGSSGARLAHLQQVHDVPPGRGELEPGRGTDEAGGRIQNGIRREHRIVQQHHAGGARVGAVAEHLAVDRVVDADDRPPDVQCFRERNAIPLVQRQVGDYPRLPLQVELPRLGQRCPQAYA